LTGNWPKHHAAAGMYRLQYVSVNNDLFVNGARLAEGDFLSRIYYFESLCVNPATGEDAIKTLIIDKDVPSFGHRNHLPGIGEWNSSLTDIGIGFAKIDSGTKYTTYVSVVIAKHN